MIFSTKPTREKKNAMYDYLKEVLNFSCLTELSSDLKYKRNTRDVSS